MTFIILTRRSPRHVWVLRATVQVPPNDIWVQVGKYVDAHHVLDDTNAETIAVNTLDGLASLHNGRRGSLTEAAEREVVIRVIGREIAKGRGFDPHAE